MICNNALGFIMQQRHEGLTSCDSVENSKFGPSMTASTGQASWQNPQYMHLVMSMSYLHPQALSQIADTHVATVQVIVTTKLRS